MANTQKKNEVAAEFDKLITRGNQLVTAFDEAVTWTPSAFPLGFFGNKSVLLYDPSTNAHPSVDVLDAVSENIFYCNTWGLFARQSAEVEDGHITGHPDRTIWTPTPMEVSGQITQKMLARGDGSPDYVLMRLYEHCRHTWAGGTWSIPTTGAGVQGLEASQYSPHFSLLTDVMGVFARCQVDSIELVAEADQQAVINYDVVANHQWTEDAPAVRDLLSSLATAENAQEPMRQVFSTDCGISVGDIGDTVDSPFDTTAGGSSDLMLGYQATSTGGNDRLVKMTLKIENFMKPNHTMRSRESWDTRAERDIHAFERFKENIWPRSYYNSQQRRISAQLVWITDVFPFEIYQRIAGTATNQMYDPDENIGESLLLHFGPLVIKIVNPIWSLPEPQVIPDDLMVVTANMVGATDGPLALQPTENWVENGVI